MKIYYFDAIRLTLLLCLLFNFVFYIFYKDVFVILINNKIKQLLDFKQIAIIQNENISLTETEVFQIFLHLNSSNDLHFVTQTCIKIINIEILFA